MGSKAFSIGPNGPKRIEAKWSMGYRKTTITVDGQPMAEIHGKAQLKQGAAIPLSNGEYLEAQFVSSTFVGAGLQIRLGGIPVAGSALSASKRLATMGGLFVIFGVIQLAIGWWMTATDPVAGPVLLGSGVLNGIFSYGAFKSMRGMGLAGAITYSVLFTLYLGLAAQGAETNAAGLIVPIIIIIGLWRTLPSTYDVEAEKGNGERYWGVAIETQHAVAPPSGFQLPSTAPMSPAAGSQHPGNQNLALGAEDEVLDDEF